MLLSDIATSRHRNRVQRSVASALQIKRTTAMLLMKRAAQTAVRSTSTWRKRHKASVPAKRLSCIPALSFLHQSRCRHHTFRLISSHSNDLQPALARTATVHEVMDVWEAHRDSIYTHNVVRSCLFYSLKAAKYQRLTTADLFAQHRFGMFWKHLVDEIPSMSANTAIKCLYNCAQYDFKDQKLVSSLIDVCTQKSKSIPSVSIGILLWSLKRLDVISSPYIRPLLIHIIDHFHAKLCSGGRFKTHSLSNILWVLASTGNLPEHVGEKVIDCLPQYMQEFDLHSLSLCLWSVTTSAITLPRALLDSAGNVVAKHLQNQKNVQNIVHCCWAFASAEYYHESFCNTLSQLILREPRNSSLLTARLLSSVVWMCGKVSYYDPVLLDHVANLACDKLQYFNAQDLGNLMYAYTQLNHPHRQLVMDVTKQFISDQKLLCDDNACVSIAWANVTIGEYPLPLLQHIMEPHRVRCLIESRDQNNLNFLLRLQVLLKAECPDIDLELPHEMDVFISALVESQWSHTHTKLVDSIVNTLLKITPSHSHFTLEALTTTLYSIDIELILDAETNPIAIPEHWKSWKNLHSLSNSHLLTKTNPKLKSLLQESCNQLLPENGCVSRTSNQTFNLASDWAGLVGGPVIPIAFRVAVEVDGPWHYAANCPHTLGKTLLKHRILRCLGWNVLSIPYFEWQTLKTEQAQVEFLKTNIFK